MHSGRALPLWQSLRQHVRGRPATAVKFASVRHTASTQSSRVSGLRSTAPYPRKHIAHVSTASGASRIGHLVRLTSLAVITIATGTVGGIIVGWGCNTWLYIRWGRETAKHGKNVAAQPQMDVSFFGQGGTRERDVTSRGWVEIKSYELAEDEDESDTQSGNTRGKHMTYETLGVDKQELNIRGYVNAEKKSTLLVFMADYGVEGWPRVVHGGITTSLIYDALRLHAKHFPQQAMLDNMQVELNYRRPIDTRKTYVVSLETRPQDSADSVLNEQFSSTVVDVKVQEILHYSEQPSSNARRVPPNVMGTAVVFLSSAEILQPVRKSLLQVGAKAMNQYEEWVQEYNESWKERQQRKLDPKPTKSDSGKR